MAACGGSDDAGEPGNEPSEQTSGAADEQNSGQATETTVGEAAVPAGLPAECVQAPTEFEFTMTGSDTYTGAFSVEAAAGSATPIVPNGDGSLDDLTPQEFNELGAESSLLLYTQYIGDHSFSADENGFLSGPEPPAGSITLGLTVVPISASGLATGDVIASTDEREYDSITTFGTVGVFFQPPEGTETYFVVNNMDEAQGGSAEVLYVDDEWLCVNWSLAGETREPEGTYSLNGTILTTFERKTTPFT